VHRHKPIDQVGWQKLMQNQRDRADEPFECAAAWGRPATHKQSEAFHRKNGKRST